MSEIELNELAIYSKQVLIPRMEAFDKLLKEFFIKNDQEKKEGLSSDISYNRRRKEIERFQAQYQHLGVDQD